MLKNGSRFAIQLKNNYGFSLKGKLKKLNSPHFDTYLFLILGFYLRYFG